MMKSSYRWKKLGIIFKACGQQSWMHSHTACPFPLYKGNGHFRIFFGTRDPTNHPRIGYVDIHIDRPQDILAISKSPVLDRGNLGCFDDNGLYPGCIVHEKDRILMYYSGRSNGESIYYMNIGLAVSYDQGETFARFSSAPIMGRSNYDPWMVSTPFVIKENENLWRMWYLSGIGWHQNQPYFSRYNIKYCESRNGVLWNREGKVAFDFEGEETNLATPFIWQDDNTYYAIFSAESSHKGYRLKMAVSNDSYNWHRLSDIPYGLDVSFADWDSNCMAYPASFLYNGNRYILYSGNDNGKGGIGIAVAVKDILK